jgi:hypothetical protein
MIVISSASVPMILLIRLCAYCRGQDQLHELYRATLFNLVSLYTTLVVVVLLNVKLLAADIWT